MSQTSYSQEYAVGFEGGLYDTGYKDSMSYLAEGTVPFGKPVKLGTDPERQVGALTSSAGQAALAVGISLASGNIEQTSAGVVEYVDTTAVPVLKRGRVWVLTNDAVVAGAQANLHLSTGTFTDASVAAGIEAFTQFTAKFVTSTDAAGLAVVEIK